MTYTMPPEDGAGARRNQAIRRIQDFDDKLSTTDKVKMVTFFIKNIAVVDTYLSLTDPVIRRAWLKTLLDSDSPSAQM
jgi:hypothetical protein